MKPWLLIPALPMLAGCVSLADYGADPYAPRYQQSAYPGWWGNDAVSIDIFFGALNPWGYWDRHPSYGRVWYPGGLGPGWQPYSRGYWTNDPRLGRRWVSHDPFGFATDHYGRWLQDSSRGWYWVPGTRFQPGWTSPPAGWRPPAATNPGWRPPATANPGWRPPATANPGWRPPATTNPGWRPPEGQARPGWRQPGERGDGWRDGRRPDRDASPQNPVGAERPANRPPRGDGAGRPAWRGEGQSGRPPRGEGQSARPSGSEGATRPPRGTFPASSGAAAPPPRAERPARAERPMQTERAASPMPRFAPRESPRDTTGGTIRED